MQIFESELISAIRTSLLDIHPTFRRYTEADIQQWIRDSFDAYVLLRPEFCTSIITVELANRYRARYRHYYIDYAPIDPAAPTIDENNITPVEVLAVNSVVALHLTADPTSDSTVPYKVTYDELSAANHTWLEDMSSEPGVRQAGVLPQARREFFITPRGYYEYATLEVVLRPFRYADPFTGNFAYHFVHAFAAPAIVHHSVFLALLQDGSSDYNNQKAQEFYQLFLAAVTGEGQKT